MKFITFKNPKGENRVGLLTNDGVVDMNKASKGALPSDLGEYLKNQVSYLSTLERLVQEETRPDYSLEEVQLLAPLLNPPSFRDFMAFEKHVENSRKITNSSIPEEWFQIPVFYFSNHHAIVGPEVSIQVPNKTKCLDFELEVACIIGKQGMNIKADEADEYIFGFTILNDWSARDLQRQEMKVSLGPAKGKDFATSLGPYIITKDEIEGFKNGKGYDLKMTAKVNGKQLTSGNWKDIHYSFGEMIERASDGVTLYPGDIIGSGTVGWGCIAELDVGEHPWLESGDVVELEIEGLGILRNKIV